MQPDYPEKNKSRLKFKEGKEFVLVTVILLIWSVAKYKLMMIGFWFDQEMFPHDFHHFNFVNFEARRLML